MSVARKVRSITLTREQFLEHHVGRTFADVVHAAPLLFDEVLAFFSDAERQRRMEDAEIHHDRPPLAGVVRELEALPSVDRFLTAVHPRRSQRLRQAIGVIVRIIMEARGWQKTGRKGSLGVRAQASPQQPGHNVGGLAFWFIRGERYERLAGMPFQLVRDRRRHLESKKSVRSPRREKLE
ncbi:MAG: hypothetical protein JSS02_19900 [Planctomycetes bacterium]|nr:hypothetical protein [Planctomycetota bacterium]